MGYAILNTMKVILISQSQSEIKSLDQIKSGEFFYGLLHRRYVLTNAGINKILKNFDEGIGGTKSLEFYHYFRTLRKMSEIEM